MTRTVGATLRGAARRLEAAGVPSPGLDARLLLACALGVDQAALIRDVASDVSPAAAAAFDALLARRSAREPVSRILGYREFHGRRFSLGRSVLDPRPDSETVVAAALAWQRDTGHRDIRLLDLGTGSGALLVTLLAEWPEAFGVGLDIDQAAVETARRNARALGVGERAAFVAGDWDSALEGRFHAIVANPPYISRADLAGLEREVRDYEPRRALDGGSDGLAGHRAVARAAARLLVPAGGRLFAEIGSGQRPDVARICADAGLEVAPPSPVTRDLAGRDRVVEAAFGAAEGSGERTWNGVANRVRSSRRRPSGKAVRSPGPDGGSGRGRGAKSAEPLKA